MATKPPVTLQDDWTTTLQPWLDRVSAQLDVAGVDLDVDRVHLMTGVVAEGVQRSMAPISAFLVGAAVARGRVSRRRALPWSTSPQLWSVRYRRRALVLNLTQGTVG
ncbi:DUF6457 domain-containing protein [Brachybacterium avium]|uniref:DUF6457 domain-containing protein n=1 Tax=Brachybacterium avium TaxID=2017485 RepID=UPI001FE271A4|nr:DUF6457 domain-containing protein [Brachybacterium avium]